MLFHALPHLSTREVGAMLEEAVKRIVRHVKRRGLLGEHEQDEEDNGQTQQPLYASAVSGRSAPAGPELRRGALAPLGRVGVSGLSFDKPDRHGQVASLDGFSLHAATRVGAMDDKGREALIKYVLRPPIAQERVTQAPDGLVRITLKRPFSDGTVAVDLDPLSLLCRLAATVPAPRMHLVRDLSLGGMCSALRASCGRGSCRR